MDLLSSWQGESKRGGWASFWAGGVAGVLSWQVFISPHLFKILSPRYLRLFQKIGLFHKTQAIIYLDVVKSRVQADDPSKPLYKGSLDCVRQSYKRYQFIITDNLSASIALNAAIRNLRLLESIS